MSHIFQEFFYRPIFNLLIFLVNIIPWHDLGLAIILITVIIKIILYPLSQKSIKSQKALQDLQPKIEEIKAKYKDNKEEMSRAMLGLYKENKVNPFSSCLPLIIQFPFLIAIFQVFKTNINDGAMAMVYTFIDKPETINNVFLGFFDLTKPNYILAILAGLAQFWQTKMLSTRRPEIKSEGSKDEDMASMMNKQLLYFAPVFTVIIGLKLPGGLALYWLISTLFTVFQQLIVFRKKNSKADLKAIEGEVISK
jgi:YidC/Oxa1 family membrane protein insertase